MGLPCTLRSRSKGRLAFYPVVVLAVLASAGNASSTSAAASTVSSTAADSTSVSPTTMPNLCSAPPGSAAVPTQSKPMGVTPFKEVYDDGSVIQVDCHAGYSHDGTVDGQGKWSMTCHQGQFVAPDGALVQCKKITYRAMLELEDDRDLVVQLPDDGDLLFRFGADMDAPSIRDQMSSLVALDSGLTDVQRDVAGLSDSVGMLTTTTLPNLEDQLTAVASDAQTSLQTLEEQITTQLSEAISSEQATRSQTIASLSESVDAKLDDLQTDLSTDISHVADKAGQTETTLQTLSTELSAVLDCNGKDQLYDEVTKKCRDPKPVGVQFDDNIECSSDTKGAMVYGNSGVKVCDGTKFLPAFVPPLGSSAGQAADSCQAIVDAEASFGDGLYYIKVEGSPALRFCGDGGRNDKGGSGTTVAEYSPSCASIFDIFGRSGPSYVGASAAAAKKVFCLNGVDFGGEGSESSPGKGCKEITMATTWAKPLNRQYHIVGTANPVACNDGLTSSNPIPSCDFLDKQDYLEYKSGVVWVTKGNKATKVLCKDGQDYGGDGSDENNPGLSCSAITSPELWNKDHGKDYWIGSKRVRCGDGSSASKSAANCALIYSEYSKSSGYYYVTITSSSVERVYCDMEDGGGWMLILSSALNCGCGEFGGGWGSVNTGTSDYRIAASGSQLESMMESYSSASRASMRVRTTKGRAFVANGLDNLRGLSGTCTSCNCNGNSLGGGFFWHGGRGGCFGSTHFGLARTNDVHCLCNSNVHHWGHFHRSGVDQGVYMFGNACINENEWQERYNFFIRPQ